MWMVVYISRDKEKIDKLLSALNKCDIMTMMRSAVVEGGGCSAYEILVPQTELDEAQDVIFDTELSES